MNTADKTIQTKKLSRPGAAAARNLRVVQDLRAAEERRRQAYRQQLDDAERAAALGQSRLRRVEREQRNELDRHVVRLLGRMALATLKLQGMSGSLLQAVDLQSWKSEDLALLKSLLTMENSDLRDHQDVQANTPVLSADVSALSL